MKITIDKALIKRAIDALSNTETSATWQQNTEKDAIQALRAALAESAVEPVASQYKQELGSKNCIQCATAYLLGVPPDDVPDFERAGPDAWEAFYAFFTDRGFTAEMFPSNVEIDGDYLASGDTERGTSHMVVMRGGKLLHDPHPSNAGLKSINVVWLIVPRAGAYASPTPPADVPMLTDDEILQLTPWWLKKYTDGVILGYARVIEAAVRQKAGLKCQP